ncbi:hypothetical protein AVDCRST_MAG92-817 [uncultured Coleofasciculus sp.]|uniref:Uncharacterized protein n=1 Tax=uncultured Coleofasciculus sp. TaxID=1267456 RepID=A0A6J4HKG2_9CYAN|nr:hypothetical protein AVDCRST_MAG92-817 [uncultured Coleofasciculus sp.]
MASCYGLTLPLTKLLSAACAAMMQPVRRTPVTSEDKDGFSFPSIFKISTAENND